MLRNRRNRLATNPISLLLLSLLLAGQLSSAGIISQASVFPDFTYWSLVLSYKGGTMIYIKGGPFNVKDKNRNEVFVGTFPCVIDHYFTQETTLACRMPDGNYPLNSDHTIIARVDGVIYPCQGGDCIAQFNYDYTPKLYMVYPQATYAGEQLNMYGYNRAESIEAIQSLTVGGKNCGFTEEQLEDKDFMSFWSFRTLKCTMADDLEPGYHDLRMISTYKAGAADFKLGALGYKVGAETETYGVQIHPRIDSISTASGYQNGNRIEIKGQGFGDDPAELIIKVGDLPCKVVTTTDTSTICDLDKLGSISTAKIYEGNAGLKQQIFRVNSSLDNLYTKYEDVAETIEWAHTADLPSGISKIDLSTILSMENFMSESYYIQRSSGIFTATATGTHKFYLASDDDSKLYMSKVKIDFDADFDEPNMLELVCICPSAIDYRNYFHHQTAGELICSRDLVQGEQYYIVHLHREGYGGDEFSLSLEVPNSDSSKTNLTPQIQKVSIDNTPVREVIEITFNQITAGTFQLVFPEVKQVTLENGSKADKTFYDYKTVEMPYNISANDLRLKVYDKTHWWQLAVEKKNFDISGAETDSVVESDIKSHKYILTFSKTRGGSSNTIPFAITKAFEPVGSEPSIVIKTQASDPVRGNFKLTYDGHTTHTLGYNSWYMSMTYYLEELEPLKAGVTTYYEGDYNDGLTWFVSLDSIKGTGQTLTVTENNLTGGTSGSPNVTVDPAFRPASNNLFYRPLPPQFLSTFHKSPQLVLSRKGMDAACPTQNCDYSFVTDANSLSIATFTLTGNELTINLASGWDTHADKDLINVQANSSIKFGGAVCSITSFSLPEIKCEVPKDASNNNLIEAGDHKPVLLLKNRGYLPSAGTAIAVTPDVSAISPALASEAGGQLLTLTGKFLGTSAATTQVKFGTTDCVFLQASNNEIKCTLPVKPSGSTTLTVTVNGKVWTDSAPLFAYSTNKTPTISGLSMSSASPVVKQDLVITGTGFGTDRNKITVMIRPKVPSATLYDIECYTNNTVVTDTSITCNLSGGRSGAYYVQVSKEDEGYAKESSSGVADFNYEIKISSVSPTSGSLEAGTILTITGKNFATRNITDNQVIIGDNKEMCIVTEMPTATEIKCKTLKPQEVVAGFQTVYVTSKIIEEAVCSGTCQFKFVDTKTPTITGISPQKGVKGTEITITGTNFSGTKANNTIMLGDHTVASNVSATTTEIKFNLPELSGVSKDLSLHVIGKGKAKIDIGKSLFMLENEFKVDSISATSGSVGGNKLTIAGNAFNPKESVEVLVGDRKCNVKTATPTQITCWFFSVEGGNASTSEVKVINKPTVSNTLTIGVDVEKTCASCNYSSLDPESPSVKQLKSLDTSDLDCVKIVISGTDILAHTGTVIPYLVHEDYDKHSDIMFQGTVGTVADPDIELQFLNVASGVYDIMYFIPSIGFAHRTSQAKDISIPPASFAAKAGNANSSFSGGSSVSFVGKGLLPSGFESIYQLKVCGRVCEITNLKYDEITCTTPILNNESTQTSLGVETEGLLKSENHFSENNSVPDVVFDGDISTSWSGNTNCMIGINFGEGMVAKVTKIRLFPGLNTTETDLEGAVIQGSMTGIKENDADWTDLATVPSTVSENWNYFVPPPSTTWKYMAYRIKNDDRCRIAEFELYGIVLNNLTIPNTSDHKCDVKMYQHGVLFNTVTDGVTYSDSSTPSLTLATPALGTTAGGTTVVITGTNLDKTGSLKIDNVECVINTGSSTSTAITCTTGARPIFVAPKIEHTTANGGKAINKGAKFLYADRWSQTSTWGGESLPRKGDLVHVPVGQTLLVDVAVVPTLASLVIEGTVIFSDEMDTILDAYFIMVRDGRLEIGTPEKRYTHKVTITLHGERTSAAFPGFGNKVLMVQGGSVDVHGVERTPTWTMLGKSANVGETTIELIQEVDWAANEKIIIAPTGLDRDEYEEMTIVSNAKSGGKSTLTLAAPLKFKHYSDKFTLGGKEITIRGEVGLLTRNIVIQGDANSQKDQYGSHIMFRGEEGKVIGRFSYFETRFAGQAFQMGRYPIHYHMIGNVLGSYIEGCSIHHTFNRATTIHGVHHLLIKNNVYFKHLGHAIFVEDSAETKNTVDGNLVIHITKSNSLLKSDLKPAGIWITHPDNTIINNHIIGSDHFSFWFDLPNTSTGPSTSATVCPSGHPLGEFRNNTGHSSGIGLRIYPQFKPRMNPCGIIRDFSLKDPWELNTPVPAVFRDNFMYHNGQGVFQRDIGAVQQENLTVVGNWVGLVVAQPDNAPDQVAKLENSLFIGDNPASTFHGITGVQALHTARKDGYLIKNVKFVNFSGQSFVRTCNGCGSETHRDIGGRRTTFENLTFENVTAPMVVYRDAERDKDIFYDKDGSLIAKITGEASTGGWVTPWAEHLNVPECKRVSAPGCTPDCAVCDKTVEVLRVQLEVPEDMNKFESQEIKIFNLTKNPTGFTKDLKVEDKFGVHTWRNVEETEQFEGFTFNVVTNNNYNVHVGEGIDFIRAELGNNRYWTQDTKGVNIRFNTTEIRELYEFERSEAITKAEKDAHDPKLDHEEFLKVPIESSLSLTGKIFGDYMWDSENQFLTVQLDGKKRGKTSMKAIYCKNTCETSGPSDAIESRVRRWSVAKDWEIVVDDGATVPAADSIVEIQPTWNMYVDIPTAIVSKIKIKGRLTMDHDFDEAILNAKVIDIDVAGELRIGAKDKIYNGKKATIRLHGSTTDPTYQVGAGVAPMHKSIIVRGKLNLYGKRPQPSWTHLKASAAKGATSITMIVPPGITLNWMVGSKIVIGSSSTDHSHVDIKTITAVTPQGVITLDSGLDYFHYGAAAFKTTSKGTTLEMRAEVAVLDRNVVVEAAADETLGCSVLVPKYQDITQTPPTDVQGVIVADGVQFNKCGQKDTDKAAVSIRGVNSVAAQNASTPTYLHSITYSSFTENQGWAVNLVNAQQVDFTKNVIWNARKFGMYLKGVKDSVFDDNLMIKVRDRGLTYNKESLDVIIGVYYNDTASFEASNVAMRRNRVSSAEWFGFMVPGYDCVSDASFKPNFSDNVGHSSKASWFPAPLLNGATCQQFSHFTAFKNLEQGFANRQDGKDIKLTKMTFADNLNSVSINGGDPADERDYTIKIEDSVIYGQALPGCVECYKGANNCEHNGVYTSLFNLDTFKFKFEETRLPLHNSTSAGFNLQGRNVFKNLHFENFKDDIECAKKGKMIRLNNFYQDGTTAVYSSGIQMTNVDEKSKFFFANHTRHLNTIEFCGKRDCTGIYNTPIFDTDGSLFTSPMTLFGFNKGAGRDGDCTFHESWNGHLCNPKFGQLNINIPKRDRDPIAAPVKIMRIDHPEDTPDNMKFEHHIDSHYKLTALLKLGQQHLVEYAATMPPAITYRLLSGSSSDYAIIKVHSENPAPLYLTKGKKKIKNEVLRENEEISFTGKISCGTNFYIQKESVMYFLITAADDCTVEINNSNAIAMNARMDIPVAEFYANNGVANFIDQVAASLGISTDRVRVVSVVSGSTIVDFIIERAVAISDASENKQEAEKELQTLLETFKEKVAKNEINLGAPVLDLSGELAIDNTPDPVVEPTTEPTPEPTPTTPEPTDPTSEEEAKRKRNRNIALGVGIPFGILFIAGITYLIYYCTTKKGAKKGGKAGKQTTNETKDMPTKNIDYMANTYKPNTFKVQNIESKPIPVQNN